jgi:uncharacterized protein with ParB-like and HNH nuclease domain/predicted transport protein
MKAAETKFLKFLKRSDQLEVPIYQRTYSWTRPECLQLWSDIVRASENDVEGHFIGSIVYIDTGIYQVTGANAIEIIDGQQRLTTISLLILALTRALESDGDGSDATARKLYRDYLLQEDHEDEGVEARYKLLLTKGDRDTFMRLIDGREIDPSAAPRLLDSYNLFADQLRRTTLSLESVVAGVEKLLIVDIALERDHDNPQLIFESLNSTGLDLSQADLIRNYVLMGLPHKQQADIYNNSWYPLEQSFPAEHQDLFDRFMRDYLTMKTAQIPRIDRVYESFKSLAQSSGLTSDDLVAEVYQHSKNWVKLAFDRAEDPALREAIADLNQLKVDVVYPFLLEVLDDRDEDTISEVELVEVVRLVESYVFRRALAAIPTNILNKTFAALASEIDKENYLESLKAALLAKESYARMPTDEEVKSALLVKDVYNFRNRNYLLRKLENFERKERVDVDSYTIEHVMPQNPDLSPEWQDELGPDWKTVQEKYLHTIGNLTLTGYNPELSDRPFSQKLAITGGFRDSPLRLNHDLAKLEHWNRDEIEKRAEILAKRALKIWPVPQVPEELLEKYRKTKVKPGAVYTLKDHAALVGPIRPLFDEFRKRVLNLDAGVHEELRKQYIGYKLATNFVEVVPLASGLKLYLDITLDEINDPGGLARDVTSVGHWGTGDVEVRLKTTDGLEEVMALVRQAFDLQGEEGYEEPQWSQAGVERVVEEATDPAVQEALLQVVEAAVRNGLYPRPSKWSVMFAPQANRNRAMFTLTVRDDDRVDLGCWVEPFQTFYGLEASEVERQLGPSGPTALQAAEVAALADRLDELMVDAEPVTDGHGPGPTWNGRDFYVTIGDRSWEDAERYGFVAAGGGETYTKPLEKLFPGARVFLYKPNPVKGYVGIGVVTEKVVPVTEFEVEVDGQKLPILEAPLAEPEKLSHDADNPELREHLVRVEWLRTRPIEEAAWQPGLFTNQTTACKLRDRETIEHLEQAFGLPGDPASALAASSSSETA